MIDGKITFSKLLANTSSQNFITDVTYGALATGEAQYTNLSSNTSYGNLEPDVSYSQLSPDIKYNLLTGEKIYLDIKGLNKFVNDFVSTEDRITVIRIINTLFADSETVSDTTILTTGKNFSDFVASLDLVRVTSEKGFSDTETVSDSKFFVVIKGLTDTEAISDRSVVLFSKDLADSLTPTEQKSLSLSKSFSDTNGQQDIAYLTPGKVFTDSISSLDSFSRILNYFRTLTDTETVTDSFDRTVSYSRSLTDSSAVLDQIIQIYFIDEENDAVIAVPVNVNDDPAIVLNKFFSDLQGLQDNISKDIGQGIQDTQSSLSTIINRTVSKLLSDQGITQDEFNRILNYSRQFTDTQTVFDTITKNQEKNFSDTVSMADLIDIIYYIGRVLSDIITISETASITTQKSFSEIISITETLNRVVYKYFNDNQNQSDSGSLISSDYILDYFDYFAEYYVGEYRTF